MSAARREAGPLAKRAPNGVKVPSRRDKRDDLVEVEWPRQ